MCDEDQFTGRERAEMPGMTSTEKLGKNHVELPKGGEEIQGAPLFLQRQVQELMYKLSEANEALHKEVIERQQEEAASRDDKIRYRNILENIEDGYFEVDLEGNLNFFNEALCRITGYPPEELRGMNNRDYTEPETAKKMFEIFNRIYRTGEPSKINNYEVIKKDGTKSVME